jgi:predicted amidohydrolase
MTRIAVIQPQLALADVAGNLRRLEDLIRDAHREHAPAVILVPEACTSPNVFRKELRDTALPIDGQAFQLLTRLARELDCTLGGGFLAVRGKHAYGTYVLAEPSGAVHLHDKDTPSAWEHAFYRGGDDDGITTSAALGGATVALMSGWEWARNRTSRRARDGGAQIVLGGMCWPSMPTNWPGPLGTWMAHEHATWKRQCRELPGLVARRVGAPVAYASHVGPVRSDTPLAPGLAWPTTMIGESQICDADGRILASLSEEEGEGHVAADVTIAEPRPSDPIGERLWIQDMSLLTRYVAWYAMNFHGDVVYRVRYARKMFGWQSLPSGDLPDEIPAGDPAVAPAATSL